MPKIYFTPGELCEEARRLTKSMTQREIAERLGETYRAGGPVQVAISEALNGKNQQWAARIVEALTARRVSRQVRYRID